MKSVSATDNIVLTSDKTCVLNMKKPHFYRGIPHNTSLLAVGVGGRLSLQCASIWHRALRESQIGKRPAPGRANNVSKCRTGEGVWGRRGGDCPDVHFPRDPTPISWNKRRPPSLGTSALI